MRITAYDPDHGNAVATGAAFSAAGGDLSGTLPGPTVSGIGGVPLSGTLAGGQTWVYDAGSGTMVPGTTGSPDAELNIRGGQDVIKPHGGMGAAETFDPADGNVHTGTLDADCTFTLAAPVGTGACTLELWLAQDGTGGWAVTWPGSVTLVGALDTTASTTSAVIVESLDGGTTWTAWVAGGSGGTPASTVTGPDAFGAAAVVGTATSYAREDHDHGLPSAPVGAAWRPVMVADSDGTHWNVLVDGGGNAISTY